MALVFKDQIGHFLKPLDVFGITQNLMIDCRNLPFFNNFFYYKGRCLIHILNIGHRHAHMFTVKFQLKPKNISV